MDELGDVVFISINVKKDTVQFVGKTHKIFNRSLRTFEKFEYVWLTGA